MVELIKEQEILVNNVINKVQIYLEKNEQNLFALAKNIGFAYQPFYRLMKKKNLPTLSSLTLIAAQFDCSVSELVNDKVFVDIMVFNTIKINNSNSDSLYRIYMEYQDYHPYIRQTIVGIKIKNINNIDIVDLFYLVDKFESDGIFIVELNGAVKLIEVVSVSSKFIVICIEKKEEKVPIDIIKPLAKYIYSSNCFQKNVVFGVCQ